MQGYAAEHNCIQVRDGVVTLLEACVQVVPADRVIAPLADYLNSPKAAGAEGKVCCLAICLAFMKASAAIQFLHACKESSQGQHAYAGSCSAVGSNTGEGRQGRVLR